MQPADLEAHLFAQIGVEIAERLIHQKNLRLDDQRARQRDALLLAARQLRRITVFQLCQMDDAEQLGYFRVDLLPASFLNLSP